MSLESNRERIFIASTARDYLRELIDGGQVDAKSAQVTLFDLEQVIHLAKDRIDDIEASRGLQRTLTEEALAEASARTLTSEGLADASARTLAQADAARIERLRKRGICVHGSTVPGSIVNIPGVRCGDCGKEFPTREHMEEERRELLI